MRIKNLHHCIFLLFTLALLFGCSKRSPLEQMNDQEAFRFLKDKYQRGKYLDAANGFDFFTLNYSGSSFVDSAQYLLGMSHFELKEYLLAASAFEELYRRFPRSKLVPDAMFMVGVSYWELSPKYSLDQEYTNNVLTAFQDFIDYFPEYSEKVTEAQRYIAMCREKLAHKEYRAGVIYMKMKDYGSAAIYFQSILENFYDTEWAPKAAFQLGISLREDERYLESEEALHLFSSKYPDHPWQSKVRSALEKLHEKMRGEEDDEMDE